VRLSFFKYQGAENDFLLIDNRAEIFPLDKAHWVIHLCDRRKGVGADGLLLIETSQVADFCLRIFNSDASQPAMCGNGLRCAVDYLNRCEGLTHMRIEVGGRIYFCEKEIDGIRINLGTPRVMHWPIILALKDSVKKAYVLDTGVPHAVLFVDEIVHCPFLLWGKQLRTHSAFAPEGVNVDFACMAEDSSILLRTYERGVEDETFACGTGAAAAAWVARQLYSLEDPVVVQTRSSQNNVCFHKSLRFLFPRAAQGEEMVMIGPAQCVFSGEVKLNG
jgi:diaminopimelate epimerase